jgi:hypothetical protein
MLFRELGHGSARGKKAELIAMTVRMVIEDPLVTKESAK